MHPTGRQCQESGRPQTNSKFRWLHAPDLNPRWKSALNAGSAPSAGRRGSLRASQ
jgi:hypothetical protein